jgi:hypothetical protein
MHLRSSSGHQLRRLITSYDRQTGATCEIVYTADESGVRTKDERGGQQMQPLQQSRLRAGLQAQRSGRFLTHVLHKSLE